MSTVTGAGYICSRWGYSRGYSGLVRATIISVFLALAFVSSAQAAPKPIGVLSLANVPGSTAVLEMHLARHPQQPNLVVRCGDWHTEQLLGRGVMDATVTVGLPEGATQCQGFVLDEGSKNGKDPQLVSNVLFWTVQ